MNQEDLLEGCRRIISCSYIRADGLIILLSEHLLRRYERKRFVMREKRGRIHVSALESTGKLEWEFEENTAVFQGVRGYWTSGDLLRGRKSQRAQESKSAFSMDKLHFDILPGPLVFLSLLL